MCLDSTGEAEEHAFVAPVDLMAATFTVPTVASWLLGPGFASARFFPIPSVAGSAHFSKKWTASNSGGDFLRGSLKLVHR